MSEIKEMFEKSSKRLEKLRKNIEETEEYITEEAKRIRKAHEKGELNENQKNIAMKALNNVINNYGEEIINLQEELINQTSLLQQLKEQPDNNLTAANESIVNDLKKMREEALTINQLSKVKTFAQNAEDMLKIFKKGFKDF